MPASSSLLYQVNARIRPSGKLDGASIILSFAAFLIGTFMIAEAIALLGFHSLAGWPAVIGAIGASTALTAVYLDRMRTTTSSVGKLDGASIIVSFAAFLIGTFMIAEAIALWGFHSLAGWPGVIGAIGASTALTVVYLDRMRTTNDR